MTLRLPSLRAFSLLLAIHARADPPLRCSAQFEGLPLGPKSTPRKPWQGVASSRAADGVIALWSKQKVVVSRDDGRTFAPLHARFTNIRDVEVGAAGTVFVLDGNHITMGFARGHIRRVETPHDDFEYGEDEFVDLVVGAGYLAHVSRNAVALTRDYGATWRIEAYPSGPDAIHVRMLDGGAFEAVLTHYNCHSGDWDESYRVSADGTWQGLPDDSGLAYRGYVQHDDGIYRTAPERDILLTAHVPAGFFLHTSDACHRLLGLVDGRLVRWSRATGFRELAVRESPL